MALITCPECGRKEVSISASVCPNCGYPIKQHFENSIVYYDVFSGRATRIFDSGLSDGIVGKCYEDEDIYKYNVVNDQLYVKRRGGTATYTIVGDYLLNKAGSMTGTIPDGNLFNTTCTHPDDVLNFLEDGKCTKTSYGTFYSGTYVRKDDLVALSIGDNAYKPYCNLICNGALYFASDIKEDRVSDVRDLISNFYTHFASNTSNNTNNENTSNSVVQPTPDSNQTPNINSSTHKAQINWHIIIKVAIVLIIAMLLLKFWPSDSYNSNDNKCDMCGKPSYTKLSDGNEYCYEHYKSALNYYLDD